MSCATRASIQVRFGPHQLIQTTILCVYLYSCLQQNHLLTLMPRKLSRNAQSERLLKAFLSAWKARIKRAHQQILRGKRNLRRDGLCRAANESSSSDSEPTGSVTLRMVEETFNSQYLFMYIYVYL